MQTAQTAEQTSFFESKMTGLPLKSRLQQITEGGDNTATPEMTMRS
jgi:hypothetical protein